MSWKYVSKLRWKRKFSALLDWILLSGIVLAASVHCSNHDSSLFSVAVAAADLYSIRSQYASRAPPVPPSGGMRFVTFAHEWSMRSITQSRTAYREARKEPKLLQRSVWKRREGARLKLFPAQIIISTTTSSLSAYVLEINNRESKFTTLYTKLTIGLFDIYSCNIIYRRLKH